jgi:cell wall-associated NlpC family hydrolase
MFDFLKQFYMKKFFVFFFFCLITILLSVKTLANNKTLNIKHHHKHYIHKHKKRHHRHKNKYSYIPKNTTYKKNLLTKIPVDSAITPDTILNNFVKDWYGTRYVWGGNSKRGVDCSGFTKILYDSIYHVKLPRTAQEQFGYVSKISKDSLVTGNLIFFHTYHKTKWHVGVYLVNGYFIHASCKKNGVIISTLFSSHYIKAFKGAGKINESYAKKSMITNYLNMVATLD